MDRDVIDDENLPLSRKSRLPGEGFFILEEVRERERDQEAADALEGAEVAVIADADADGLACVALIQWARGEAALLPAGPHDLENAMERVVEFGRADLDVFVCDLAPDRYEYVGDELEALLAQGATVTWYDHHQWDDDVADAVRDAGVDLVVGDSEEECTADVVVRSMDVAFPPYLTELAVVTRDHDLWIKEDPRSDDLADYAYWSEAEEYVETVREHGAELPDGVEAFLTEQRIEKEALIERAIDRARFVDIGEWTVGVTYGRCSQNEVAEGMREQGADASVIVKPAGSASIRGSETFERCHEVAKQVNGGGHPRAAGCKPDIYDDMLDYAQHWVTEGAVAQRRILAGFETLLK